MALFGPKGKYVYTLDIQGMMCGMCEAHVNDIVRKSFDVIKVKSSHLKNQTLIYTNNELDEEQLISAIKATGYEVRSIKREVR